MMVDTRMDRVVVLRHEDPAVPLNQTMVFSDFIRSRIQKEDVHPDDADGFDVLLDPELLRRFCAGQNNGILLSYRRMWEGGYRWARLLINVPEDYSADQPNVLVSTRYLSERETDEQEANHVINASVQKVIKYDYVTGETRVIRQPRGEEKVRRRRVSDYGLWNEEEGFVHPDDVEDFHNATGKNAVLEWFRAGNEEKDIFYRRRTGTLYRWVKMIVHPALDDAPEHPKALFYVVDIHRTVTKLNAAQGQLRRTNRNDDKADLETYYENVFNVLSFFTQKYTDFFVVDLVTDRYIKYKINRDMVEGVSPYIGCYSQMASHYLQEALPGEPGQNLQVFASIGELRMILEDKVSFEYTFTLPDGKHYRTVCTRIAAEAGVPTKMIVRTLLEKAPNRLQIRTFGSFQVFDGQGNPITFKRKKSRQLLAYLVDKYGFPAATADIITDVLEKHADDLNSKKYVSALYHGLVEDLAAAGYPDVVVKEWNSLRIIPEKLDCDYYHLMEGDASYWGQYHNEYMKEYSWAEETNAEILEYGNR